MARVRQRQDESVKSSGSSNLLSRQTRIAGPFNGFPHEAFDFFEQLARYNNRDWFHAHQEVYERACREPMKQLVAELGANPVRRLTSAPRGYPADHPRIELLRMKDIFAGKTFAPEAWLSTWRAVQRIRRVNDVRPLADWLRVHVGARQ